MAACKHAKRLDVITPTTTDYTRYLRINERPWTSEDGPYPTGVIIVRCADCGRTVRGKNQDGFPAWAKAAIRKTEGGVSR